MRLNESEEIMDYVSLFVSVLICFPEVGTIRYERESGSLFLTFILKRRPDDPALKAALDSAELALSGYHRLEAIEPDQYDVRIFGYEGYTVLETRRDMKTVTRAEISFLIELFRLKFENDLIVENVDQSMLDDYGWYHRDEAELANDRRPVLIEESGDRNKILVMREAGRVLVFSN